MIAAIDFPSSREKAMVIWCVLLSVYVWRKDNTIGAALLQVLRSMFAPVLSLLWAAAAAYCTGVVFAAHAVGLWHMTAIKETIYWFVGTGAVLTGSAITTHSFDRAFVKRLARKALRFTIIVEFLINLYVMPLAAELVLVPLVALFVIMQVVAENDPKLAAVKKFLDRALILTGGGIMVWVIASALTDLGGLLTREHAEGLLLAPAFTLAFIPFFYGMWLYGRWDLDRAMRRWRESKAAV